MCCVLTLQKANRLPIVRPTYRHYHMEYMRLKKHTYPVRTVIPLTTAQWVLLFCTSSRMAHNNTIGSTFYSHISSFWPNYMKRTTGKSALSQKIQSPPTFLFFSFWKGQVGGKTLFANPCDDVFVIWADQRASQLDKPRAGASPGIKGIRK